jgi:large subunit ribosomal protein L21e
MAQYNPGDKVDIKIEPSVQKGQPHRRFHGKTAEVVGSRGKAFLVQLRDGKAQKMLIIRPEHLHLHVD